MRYVIAFEQVCQDAATTESIRLKSDEDEDWWREWVVGALEM